MKSNSWGLKTLPSLFRSLEWLLAREARVLTDDADEVYDADYVYGR